MPPLRCPICGKRLDQVAEPVLPFCSRRCQQIDLARWLDEKYGLPCDPADPETPEASPEEADSSPADEGPG